MNITESLNSSLSSASPMAIALAFAGGVLASLTPCVYPLIPVTIAFIGGIARGNRMKSFVYSLLYILGIAVVYSALGAFAALGGTMFGSWASSPWGYLVMGNICIGLALSFFGLYEINIRLVKGQVSGKSAAIMALLTGAVAALTASACTAPVLAVLLSFVAQSQNVAYGIVLLFSFSLGFSMLLLIAGTFSGAAMPRAGRWMIAVKTIFGIILLLMGEYYLIRAGKNFVGQDVGEAPAAAVSRSKDPGPSPSPQGPEVTYDIPDFTLQHFDSGQTFNLHKSIGEKNLVFLFFATWCGGCMEELPEICEIKPDYPDTRFIAVNNKETPEKIAAEFKAKGIIIECLTDFSQSAFKAYKINAIPYVVIIDRSGRIALEGTHSVKRIRQSLEELK